MVFSTPVENLNLVFFLLFLAESFLVCMVEDFAAAFVIESFSNDNKVNKNLLMVDYNYIYFN